MEIYFKLNFKFLRKRSGIEREQLASDFGVTLPNISNWETGKHLPKVETLIQIAAYFKVSLDDLLLKNLSEAIHEMQENSEAYLPLSKQNSHELADLRRRLEEMEAWRASEERKQNQKS